MVERAEERLVNKQVGEVMAVRFDRDRCSGASLTGAKNVLVSLNSS